MRRLERLLPSYCRPANRPVSQSNPAVAATTESVSSKIEIMLINKKYSKLVTASCCLVTIALSLGEPSLLHSENTDSLGNTNGYMSSARELLHHLHLLEKGQVRSDIHKVTVQ